MSDIGKRIRKVRKDLRISQEELARRCGWSDAQTRISSYENGRTEPSYKDLITIAGALEVNPAYLAFGSASDREQGEVDQPKGQPATSASAGASTDDVRIANLSGGKANSLRLPRFLFDEAGVDPKDAVWVEMTDNSMKPVIPPGSIVAIDTSAKTIRSGQCYAVEHGGLLRVKLVYEMPKGAMRLRSYNDDEWPDEIVEGEDLEDFKVIGRVFWYSVVV